MTTLFTDDFKSDPYWWEDIPPPSVTPAPVPANADVVIIGSGYTGLHAALQTARASRSTVILDAERAGWGCSTRNGGQISTSVKPVFDDLCRKYDRGRAFRIHQEGQTALQWLESFIGEEKIGCNFTVCGRFHAAHTPVAYEKLGQSVKHQVKGLEVEAHMVPRSEQRGEIGTDAYHGGIVYQQHASLHPARYHLGLLQLVEESGASVYSHCPAVNIERDGPNFKVITNGGTIIARDVIVASNGYTGKLTPWQRRRVIPIGSYMIATEPLPSGLMDELNPRHRIFSDTRKVSYYFRASPDRGRLLFGGRVTTGETDARLSAPLLHLDMTKIFPQLADIQVSHSWMGFVAYTFDTLAHIGKHKGIHYALGYCGSGVSMASYLGMRLGQQVLGETEGKTGFDGLAFQTRPFYSGNPWFLGQVLRYYKWRDKQTR